MYNLIKRFFALFMIKTTTSSKASTSTYYVDKTGIHQLDDEDNLEKLYLWQNVEQVMIITTSDGPFFEDVFFVIKVSEMPEILCISHSEAVKISLFDGFANLPGFNYEQVILAMGSCVEASFTCFEKPLMLTKA